jgi:integrase
MTKGRNRRDAGQGAIDELPSGRYRARYRAPDGKRVTRTFTARADANAWLGDERAAVRHGTWISPDAGQILLQDYAREWLEGRTDLRATTAAKYWHLLERHVLPTLGGLQINAITPSGVRGWYMKLRAEHAVTADDSYRLLRTILNTAVSDGLRPSNPCRIKGAGQVRSSDRPIASIDEIAAAVEAMPERLRLAPLLCSWCHLRRGEVIGLQRHDVNLLHEKVRVERALAVPMGQTPVLGPPKTEAGLRELTIPDNIIMAVEDHLDRFVAPTNDAWLFATSSGTPVSPRNLYRAWSRARRAAGRPDLRLHDLRRTGLTWVAIAGATTKEIMRRGGHSNPRAALMYQHAAESRDREIAASLAKLAKSTVQTNSDSNEAGPGAVGS